MSKSSRRLFRATKQQIPAINMNVRGPISFPDLTTARQHLKTPADANYVMWNPSWPASRDLEDVFATELAANDILVLPERSQPYIIDSSEGFRAAGVQSVTGRNGQLPIVNRYKGIRNARTWFAMARARRGILGMGPGAVIKLSQSSWTQEPQIPNKNAKVGEWVSPGRIYTDTSGTVRNELIGAQEKIIEAEHPRFYFGNFAMRAHDLGGVAYTGLANAATGNHLKTFEHLDLSNSWRGFSAVPNGESGALAVAGGGTYYAGYCLVGTRDSSGVRVGTSPIMINTSIGGTIEEMDTGENKHGMMTIWNSTGKHIIKNVNSRFNIRATGINLEKCQAGFEVEWTGGSIWSDYNGNGGKTPRPADQPSSGGGLHIGLFAESGSPKITLRGVDLDKGATAGHLNIQSYGASQHSINDIKCYDANNVSIPIKIY